MMNLKLIKKSSNEILGIMSLEEFTEICMQDIVVAEINFDYCNSEDIKDKKQTFESNKEHFLKSHKMFYNDYFGNFNKYNLSDLVVIVGIYI